VRGGRSPMFSRYEIRLSGTGGQGLVLAGMILSEAIAFGEKKQVVQSQNYGPEARGTNSRSDIIISDQEIDYPKALHLDALLALNQAALDENFPALKEEGLLIVDSELVQEIPPVPYVGLPLTRLAKESSGFPQAANMVALGALAALTGKVSPGSLAAVLSRYFREEQLEGNIKALRSGARYAKELFSGRSVKPDAV
jgi:2-oxoglutarate ferredoxin oxidoreductase subunit gamma